MEIVFYFPINYKHGRPSDTEYYIEKVQALIVGSVNQDLLNDIFKDTEMYRKFRRLSFTPYVYWKSVSNHIYVAVPHIYIWYKKRLLKYMHTPTYREVKLDFYLLTNENNGIDNTILPIIEGNPMGSYVISMDSEVEKASITK